ncbi:MAG: outer membrane protein assembly factor BamE [Bdellovibrionales bacterium]|jgi:outer membrane protein assembly factor BamE (lipoprotein component of BamABCDE complex)|nr:outer membrane protein assembly factor BamE [Bdellovibrionales bacterium]
MILRRIFGYADAMPMRPGSFLTALALVFLFGGCQTPRYKEFEDIRVGMSKGEVLSAAGNPSYSKRWQGKDRWTYILHDHPEGKRTREVHFEEGHVIYIGISPKPTISAEEQDVINENINLEAAEAEELAKDGVTIQKFRQFTDDEQDKSKTQP